MDPNREFASVVYFVFLRIASLDSCRWFVASGIVASKQERNKASSIWSM
jgi:hypothetical protein